MFRMTRRGFVGTLAAAPLAAPGIVRAQTTSEPIKIGLLSDVGGFPEIEATGAARIVPAGNALALGHALRELLADRATLAKMCVKARAAATGRYSWPAIAAAHLELYSSI